MTPLQGKRVLDLTRLLPGPYATLLLAELGAEVLKIEPPQGDPLRRLPPYLSDGQSARFVALNRGKKSVVLDLKQAGDQEKFYALAAAADAVVEGFRPGVATRLGVDYDALIRIRPQIVYCSLSGYGQSGPYRNHVGHDLNYVGVAGMLGLSPHPRIPGVQVGDLAGGMFAALGVVAALWAQEKNHQGQYLDVSLTDSALHWMGLHLAAGPSDGPQILSGDYPFYSVYQTQDGRWLSVGCLEPKFWVALCERLGLGELVDQQFAEGKQRQRVYETLRDTFRAKPLAVWLKELDPTQIPVAPVHDVAGVLEDPQLKARGVLDPPGVRSPLAFSQNGRTLGPAPALGEHNDSV